MMRLSPDPVIRELQVWVAYADLAEEYGIRVPASATLGEVFMLRGQLTLERERAIGLLMSHGCADRYEDARRLLEDVLVALGMGRRPRTPREFGLTRRDFESEEAS